MKVSDHVVDFFTTKGVEQVFCIAGGAAAHLLESVRKSNLNTIFNYNEQACAMAADGYARISKKPAIVLVTNGPGSTNTITGVLGAWQDGIPMIIISGQVPRHQTMAAEPQCLRQMGVQESDIITMVAKCTKYAKQIMDARTLPIELEKAWRAATTGRMGPVWLDIPIDVQAEQINNDIEALISNASRPVIIVGNGIHLANAEEQFINFTKKLKFPVVCNWNATDLFDWNDPLYIGNPGLFGERAANLAIQNADLILIIGTRMSIPCIGYDSTKFAPSAIHIMVDIDENEILKRTMNVDAYYYGDLRDFMKLDFGVSDVSDWVNVLNELKNELAVFDEPHTRVDGRVNSYDLIQNIGSKLEPGDIVVTDMGTSFTCTMQALRNTGANRLFTSSGLCSMGFGLPGAIGAWASDPSRRVICIAGDGGIQMNIQEFQTIIQHAIPLKIIVLNNGGYLAISLMQDNLFKNRFGSNVGSPNFSDLARAYGIKVANSLDELLATPGPVLYEVSMVRDQLLIPRVASHRDPVTNQIRSGNLETMFPFLSAERENDIKARLSI